LFDDASTEVGKITTEIEHSAQEIEDIKTEEIGEKIKKFLEGFNNLENASDGLG
jgi:hypothetical protein